MLNRKTIRALLESIGNPPLEKRVSKIPVPSLVYIQTQNGFHPVISGDAFYGVLLQRGEQAKYLRHPSRKVVLSEDNMGQILESVESTDPAYEQQIDLLHDGKSSGWTNFHYNAKEGIKLLLYGFNLYSLKKMAFVNEFPRRYRNQVRNQLLINTEYLEKTEAQVFFNEEIEGAMKLLEKDAYSRILRKLNHTTILGFFNDDKNFGEIKELEKIKKEIMGLWA